MHKALCVKGCHCHYCKWARKKSTVYHAEIDSKKKALRRKSKMLLKSGEYENLPLYVMMECRS